MSRKKRRNHRASGERPGSSSAPVAAPFRIVLFVGIALLGRAAVLAAQTADTPTFEERTSVVLIEVPVQVLENGEPVGGLGRENFELYDDGERREIFSFDVLDFSGSPGAAQLPMTQEGGPALGPRRNFLFLIDFAYPDSWDPKIGAGPITAAIHGMMDTWHDLTELLEARFHPEDRIALAYFSPLRGLKMLQGWTSNRESVGRAMDTVRLMIEARPDRLRETWSDWEIEARSTRRGGPEGLWAQLDDLLSESRTAGVRADPFLPHREVSKKLFEGLIAAGKTLEETAGPRHVVYLSTGFPGASLRDLRRVIQQFRRTHWAIQSINTGGLGFGSGSLHMLSNETGGQVFSNSNRVSDLLGEMAKRTAVTYALMFEASGEREKATYHRLRVKLVGGPKGAEVVHRRGYYTPGVAAERAQPGSER